MSAVSPVDLESKSYREGFAPKKVLRRSSPLNRTFNKKNNQIQRTAAGDENESPLEPNSKRPRKSSTPRGNLSRERHCAALTESSVAHQTPPNQQSPGGTVTATADEATDRTPSTHGVGGGAAVGLSPRRCLQRTPPVVTMAGGKMDDPFTPSRSMKRTPPMTRSQVVAKATTKEKEGTANPFAATKSLKRTPYVARPAVASKLDLEDEKEMESPFTPSKSLKRTPPVATPRVRVDGKQQEEPKTPSLAATRGGSSERKRGRSSVKTRGRIGEATGANSGRLDTPSGEEGGSKGIPQGSATSGESVGGPGSADEGVFDLEKRGVQASCFTPKKILRRSLRSGPEPQANLAGAVSPTSKCEIARTPESFEPSSRLVTDTPDRSSRQGHEPLTHHNQPTQDTTNDIQNNVSKRTSSPASPKNKGKKPLAKKKIAVVSKRERAVPSGVDDNGVEDVPPGAKFKISRTPPASQKEVSSGQDGHKATQIPATSHMAAPLAVIDDVAHASPPTSHWEIPRTPPPQVSVHTSSASVSTTAGMTTEDNRSGQGSGIVNAPSVTSPLTEDHAPSPKRTPSFELAANIVKSIASRSPAAISRSSKRGIREALAEQNNVPAHAHTVPSSGFTPAPNSHWEIPRTPVEIVNYESVQLSPSKSGFSRTPSRVKVPAHPLSLITSSKPETNFPPPNASELSPPIAIHGGQQLTNTSPPTCVEQVALPGLQCTDEDLAFLERRKNLVRLKELQAKSDKLAKEEKCATEEKEQLEHAYMKVQQDIAAMRGDYWDVVIALQAMVEDPVVIALPETHPPPGENAGVTLPILKQSDSEQLRKLNLQAASQLDKLEKKLQARREEMEAAKVAHQMKLTQQEQKRQSIEARISYLEAQKSLLDQKLSGVGSQLASVEEEVRLLHGEVAKMEGVTAGSSNSGDRHSPTSVQDRQARLQDKAVVEERLKILIRRCELYCKRRQMLEHMGVIKRSRNS